MALVLCVCSLMPMAAFAASNDVGGGNAVFNTQSRHNNDRDDDNDGGYYHEVFSTKEMDEFVHCRLCGQRPLRCVPSHQAR